jgi:hypothetical protein
MVISLQWGVGFPTRNPQTRGSPPRPDHKAEHSAKRVRSRIDGANRENRPPPTQLFCFREAPWIIDLTMLGGLCLCRSGRFFDGVHFVHGLDVAMVHCLASGVMIATHDVERRTTLPLPVTDLLWEPSRNIRNTSCGPVGVIPRNHPRYRVKGRAEVGRYRGFAGVCVRVAKNHGEGCRPRSCLVLRIPTVKAGSQYDLGRSSQGRGRPKSRRR